jgi:hypothetical protein
LQRQACRAVWTHHREKQKQKIKQAVLQGTALAMTACQKTDELDTDSAVCHKKVAFVVRATLKF